jgi:hypothetical protein
MRGETDMALKHCLVTGEPLGPENTALAHVIPNSIGGNLKYRGLISRNGNEILNRKFDVGIGAAYRNIMAAVGGKRDRGRNLPAKVFIGSGEPFYWMPGKPLVRVRPVVQDGPDQIAIYERYGKDARRTLAGKLAKHIQNTLDALPAGAESPSINVALKSDRVEQFPISLNASKKDIQRLAEQIADCTMNESEEKPQEAEMFLGIPAGPSLSFPAAYVMVSLYAARFGVQSPQFRGYVEAFDPANVTLPPSAFYFMPDSPLFGADAQLAHQLVLIASATHQSVFGYVSIFGLEEVVVVLPYQGSSDFTHSYAVDVITGRKVNVRNIEAGKALLPYRQTPEPGGACFQAIEQRIRRVANLIQEMI